MRPGRRGRRSGSWCNSCRKRGRGNAPCPPEASMAKTPPLSPDDQRFISCPYCTIQIPAEGKVCPHCQQVLNTPKKLDRPPAFQKGSDFLLRYLREGQRALLADLWARYGKWS